MATTENDKRGILSPNVVVTLIVIVVLYVITILGYLVLAGRQLDDILPVLTAFAIPTVTGLLALVKIERQGSAVETIRRNTNGAFERMEQRMAALERPVHDALNTGEMPVANTRTNYDDEPLTERFPTPSRLPKGGTDNG